MSHKLETGSQRKRIKRQENAKYKLFNRISFTSLGGMWKNCSVMELLQILTHKLLINDSHKSFKKIYILSDAPFRNQSIDLHCLAAD